MTPKAAEDLPLPCPVLMRTIESARPMSSRVGGVAQGTRCESGAVPQLSPGSNPPAPWPRPQLGGKAGGERIREPGNLPARLGSEEREDVMMTTPFPTQLRSRREAGQDLPTMVWRLTHPLRAIASAPHGGGLGTRRWVVNAQVPSWYRRRGP